MPLWIYRSRQWFTEKSAYPPFVFDHALDREDTDLNFRISSRAYHISASGQPNKRDYINLLTARLPTTTRKVWIISLRDETTLYINDQPVSIFMADRNAHVGLAREIIFEEENILANYLLRYRATLKVRRLMRDVTGVKTPQQPVIIRVENILTEQQLIDDICFKNNIKIGCLRLCVTDHGVPDPFEIDLFVEFVRTNLSVDDWVHFHCRAGKGRSAQFVAMLKALYAAKYPHIDTAGDLPDVLSMDKLTRGSISELSEAVDKRCSFIEDFQEYAKDGFMKDLSWSEWLEMRSVRRYSVALELC